MLEAHKLEQYFWDAATTDAVADVATRFENPCGLCAPMMGRELAKRRVKARVLDIDTRFSDVPGFLKYDVYRPVWLGEAFGVIVCDPPFWIVSLAQLFGAIRLLARHDYAQPVAICYPQRRGANLCATFARFELKPSGFLPRYRTVQDIERNQIEFYCNFAWDGSAACTAPKLRFGGAANEVKTKHKRSENTMKQRQLGPNGPLVGAIGLGGMPLSIKGDRPSEPEATQLLTRAAELGMTLWDTADAYCLNDSETGHNERLFAAAYHALPADLKSSVVLATKGGHIRPDGAWVTDGRPKHLREALDASLLALKLEVIPLYQFHRPDPKVPFADSVGVLKEALDAGKIRFAGLSNVSVAQIDEAMQIVPITSVQNQFSPTHLAPENDGVLEHCRSLGLAFLPWSPLGGMGGAKGIGDKGALAEIAVELGISPQRVVLAWHLAKYERSLPIPGASRLESVEDSAKGSDIELSGEQIARLDASFAG